MATPSEILNDPDFVSANAATKQAIFNKHVAQDPDFIGASGATQQAIRTRFGFEQPAVPTAPARRSIADVGKGLSESSSGLTDMSQSLAANMVMAPVAGIAGIGQGIKNLFVDGGMPAGDRVRQIQDAVAERYAPKTVAGTNALNGISPALNFLPEVGNYAGEKVAEMGKYIPFSTPEMDAARGAMVNTGIQMMAPTALIKGVSMLKGGKTAAPALEQTAAAKAAAEQAYLVRQAGIMNTVVEGNKIGLVAVPSHMNPTPMGSVKATVFGKNAQIGAASEANTKTLPSIAKRQMGIDQRVSIAGDEGKAAVVKALAEHDAPYVEIAALPKLNVLPEAMQAIEALRQRPALGAKAEAAAANAVIDDAIAGLTPKVDSVMRTTTYAKSPAEVLADIKSVREQAQTVFDSVAPTSTEVAAANARWALAKQLERILDDTAAATDPGLVPRFRDARTAKAQIHAWRDVITNEGKIDTPKLAMPFRKLAQAACYSESGRVILGRGYSQTEAEDYNFEEGSGNSDVNYSFVAQLTEVEVDLETGIVKATDMDLAFDAGRPLHLVNVESQIEGAAVQGLGQALYEEFKMKDGRTLNPDFVDYRMPLATEAPDIRIDHIITDDPDGIHGVKEASQAAIVCSPPSIVAAIHDATGIWFTSLPVTPEKILAALKEKRAKEARVDK